MLLIFYYWMPHWTLRACSYWWQAGGGLYISPSGTAKLVDTNVYDNQAGRVCGCLLPFARPFFHHQRWCLVFSQASGEQTGGGLHIQGTAELVDTNVYANQAFSVSTRLHATSSTFIPDSLLSHRAGASLSLVSEGSQVWMAAICPVTMLLLMCVLDF